MQDGIADLMDEIITPLSVDLKMENYNIL